MQSISSVIDGLGYVATRNQLVARGFTGYDLTSAVRRGEIRRIRRGWYATVDATRAQLVAVRVGGRLSHASAVRSYGLWSGLDESVHIGLMRNSSRLRTPALPPSFDRLTNDPVIVLHWVQRGRVDVRSERVWRTPLGDSLRQFVATASDEDAIACLSTAITRLKIPPSDIDRLFRLEPDRSRDLARRARIGSDSGQESIACQRFERAGLEVRQQVTFPGIRPVDLLVGRRVIVELDGREFHDQSAAFVKDRRNDAKLIALGYVVLRFSYSQVMFEWDFVLEMVLAALSAHS